MASAYVCWRRRPPATSPGRPSRSPAASRSSEGDAMTRTLPLSRPLRGSRCWWSATRRSGPDAGDAIRAGPDQMRDPPPDWSDIDERGDESFPATIRRAPTRARPSCLWCGQSTLVSPSAGTFAGGACSVPVRSKEAYPCPTTSPPRPSPAKARTPRRSPRRAADADPTLLRLAAARLAIEGISHQVDGGRFAAKVVAGQPDLFQADIFFGRARHHRRRFAVAPGRAG